MNDTMEGLKRTHYCTEVTQQDVGKTVTVCGFAQKTRDQGSLVFIDLRDRTGLIQLAFNDKTDREVFEKAAQVRAEFVLMAQGILQTRESPNPELVTGQWEVAVNDLRILARAETPPFEIRDNLNVKDELRLKYRYLDLRRAEMQSTLMARHRIVKAAHDYFDRQGFLEIETPNLIKSTPEGARDYLVPSRVKPGSFFALPQSPQLYKQILMLSGFDRYMQIARCYRDEDLRADRQPEFTQIDLEMSFVGEEDVMEVNEGFMKHLFAEVLGLRIQTPFERMPYSEAMERFGSDKPDLRFGLELTDLGEELSHTGFQVFAGALQAGGLVKAIRVEGGAGKLTRKAIDKLTAFVKTYRAKGLAYTRITEEGAASSFEKFLTAEEIAAVHAKTGLKTGDVLLIVADPNADVVYQSLGALRCELARMLDLIPGGQFRFLWVTKFPLFEYGEEENRYVAKHHPFTAPSPEDLERLESDPGHCTARAYDLVLNGCEVGGGSIRINDPEVQSRMFAALGFDQETAYARFGFLLDAFRYGAPPHGGMAYGLDRLVMLMLGKDSIRDVIAFPKVQNSSELMTGCPSEVDEKALRELGISIQAQQ